MATVYVAKRLGAAGFARPVAIKRLHRHLVRNRKFAEMFADEARLAARIQHPNVITATDVIRMEDELLIVMEYVHGESLHALIRHARNEARTIPLPTCIAILSDVLYGLHAAHEAKGESGRPLGIVHRDVAPQNILVGADGIARVLDFGVAKAADRLQHTNVGTIKGRVAYMAPEQLAGGPVNRQSDVYSASVVLWEMITRERLVANDLEAIEHGLNASPAPPSTMCSGVPAELDAIVLRGLSHERTQRYASAEEMALALRACVPPAPPPVVSQWVSRLAYESLAARAAAVSEMLTGGAHPDECAHEVPPAPDEPRSGRDRTTTVARRPRSRASVSKLGGLAALLTLAGVVFLLSALGAPEAARPSSDARPHQEQEIASTCEALGARVGDDARCVAVDEPNSPPMNPAPRASPPASSLRRRSRPIVRAEDCARRDGTGHIVFDTDCLHRAMGR
jgi:serine/threonine-protein kinase